MNMLPPGLRPGQSASHAGESRSTESPSGPLRSLKFNMASAAPFPAWQTVSGRQRSNSEYDALGLSPSAFQGLSIIGGYTWSK